GRFTVQVADVGALGPDLRAKHRAARLEDAYDFPALGTKQENIANFERFLVEIGADRLCRTFAQDGLDCGFRLFARLGRQFFDARVAKPVAAQQFQAMHVRSDGRVFDAADLDEAPLVRNAQFRHGPHVAPLFVGRPKQVARLDEFQPAFAFVDKYSRIW